LQGQLKLHSKQKPTNRQKAYLSSKW
jgi:hypothetical protein